LQHSTFFFGHGLKSKQGYQEEESKKQILMPFNSKHIWDNPGARFKFRQLGRGNGSTKGKTCGKGQKGQKTRQGGKVARGFEGG